MGGQHEQQDACVEAQKHRHRGPCGREEALRIHEIAGVRLEGVAGGVREHVVLPQNGSVKVAGHIAVWHDVGQRLVAPRGMKEQQQKGEGHEDGNGCHPPASPHASVKWE